jgi:Kef-type K+ transport system membrane component KefB
MPDLLPISSEFAWPFALAVAWIAGEFAHRATSLPRISIYGLVGFLLAQTGVVQMTEGGGMLLLANLAFGLMLFELGYRINLNWLRTNPWIGASGLVEAAGTFVAVYLVAYWYGMPWMVALLTASLAMATSPAGLLRVINEQNSSGQVTERVLHLSALNCVLGVFTFKVIIGFGVFQSSGSVLDAAWSSLVELLASAGIGALFGIVVPALLRKLGNVARDATLAFAIAVILLVAVTYGLRFSPVLAALTFGMVARHRRITLNQTQRNFGVLGDLLTLVLFFYVSATLRWDNVVAGLGLALLLIVVRFATKTAGVAVFAHVSGVSWRKGLLSGVALAPISVFAVLMLEQTRYLGVALMEGLLPLTAMALVLEVIGPILTQRALMAAKETPDTSEN